MEDGDFDLTMKMGTVNLFVWFAKKSGKQLYENARNFIQKEKRKSQLLNFVQ